MTDLTPSQMQILTAAIQSADGCLEAAPRARFTIASLIRRGLMTSVHTHEGPSRVVVTEQGRAAVQPPPEPDMCEPTQAQKSELEVSAPVSTPAPGSVDTPDVSAPMRHRPKGKIGQLVALLERPEGATLEVMMHATGWQAHSVRGALSGAIRKTLGLAVTSNKTNVGRVYQISKAAKA
jgi:hypothetical protein